MRNAQQSWDWQHFLVRCTKILGAPKCMVRKNSGITIFFGTRRIYSIFRCMMHENHGIYHTSITSFKSCGGFEFECFVFRAWFKIWLTSRMAAEYLQNTRQAVLGDRLLEVIEKPFLNSVGQQVLALKAFVGISQKGQQQFASQTLRAICSGIRC